MVWEFDVGVTTHTLLRRHVVVADYRRVTVVADTYSDESLTAYARAGGGWATAGIAIVGCLLAAAALGNWVIIAVGAALAYTTVTTDLGEAFTHTAGTVGVAVTLGCVVHCVGDAVTLAGCPFLWPLPIAGETWYELRPPAWLRFRAGGHVETWVVYPLCAVLGVLLLPGVWQTIIGVVTGSSSVPVG